MTIKDKLDMGFDALCLKKGGMLYVGEFGRLILESRSEADLPFEPGPPLTPHSNVRRWRLPMII